MRFTSALRAVSAIAAVVVSGLSLTGPAIAQHAFPDKPVKIIVPYAPGGAGDVYARSLANQLGTVWKQPVVVDYKPGASSIIGIQSLIASPKDGYTLLLCAPPLATNEILYQKLPYKFDDVAGVSVMVRNPYVLVMTNTLPINNVGDLINYAKKNPGKLNFASLGPGSPTNFLARALATQTGIDIVEIPFKGSGQVLPELISGRVHMYFDSLGGALPGHRQGTTKIIGVSAPERSAAANDIPTFNEQGTKFSYDSWFGICAPSGVPAPVMAALNDGVKKAVATEEFKSQASKLGGNPTSSSSAADFDRYIKSEIDTWGKIIRPLNIKLE